MTGMPPEGGRQARFRRIERLGWLHGICLLALAGLIFALRPSATLAIPLGIAFLAVGANALRLRRGFWSALERELEQSQRAEQEARAADGAKSRLLASVSHEIRTPMHGILGMTELLLGSDPTPSQREQVELVRTSAEALLALVDDILDLARIDAGRLALRPRDFPLRELAGEVMRLLAPRAAEREVRLELDLAPELPVDLRGDPVRLRQVLLNLVGNAVRFTRQGSVTVAAMPRQDGRAIRFEVRDTGVGIRPEVQARLFQPFLQGDSSISRSIGGRGGTGLGLVISRNLVDLMDGAMGFESVRGEGSIFWFEIPWVRATGAAVAPGKPALDEGRRHARRSRCVLVVDDRSVNRAVAQALLLDLGYESAAAESGEQALALLAERRFDAVLLDREMPGLDGGETCRRLRRSEGSGRRTPVIAVTAHTAPQERAASEAAGMDAFLAKPFRTAELAAVLDRWTGIAGIAQWDDLKERLAGLNALPASPGSGPDMKTQVIAAFLEQGEDDLAAMRRALAQGDGAALAEAAHGLAGSAALLGACELAQSAGELAAFGHRGDLEACAARLPRVLRDYQDTSVRMAV